jgi:hypothetical protein
MGLLPDPISSQTREPMRFGTKAVLAHYIMIETLSPLYALVGQLCVGTALYCGSRKPCLLTSLVAS